MTGLAVLFGLACAGAAVGRLLRLPMWPVTGSILGAATAPLFGAGGATPPGWWAVAGQLLVGCGVGAMVGRDFFASLLRVVAPGSGVALLIVAVGVAGGAALAGGGVLGPAPALLGSIPGGVGEMVSAAAGMGADSGLVAGMHLMRLVVVLSALPLLLRWARRRYGGPGHGSSGGATSGDGSSG